MRKIIKAADLFCGAGGTSTGAQQAAERAGVKLDLTAINHWDVAIETHSQNHPQARHVCADINDVRPERFFRRGELDWLFASPECTHHSRARGGLPMDDQRRCGARRVLDWAERIYPARIWIENVCEFLEWGPLFADWMQCLRTLGYTVEWRIQNAANFGAPTTRQRLIVQAARRGTRLVWPDFLAWIKARKAERHTAKIVCHHLAFDRGFFSEAERVTDYEIPHRHDWRCSQVKFGELMDAGLIEHGSSSLDRLIELSGWTGGRNAEHNALQDAQAALHGYTWLIDKAKTPENTLRFLYTNCLMERKNLEAFVCSLHEAQVTAHDPARTAANAAIHAELETLAATLSEKKEGRELDGRVHDEFPQVERGTAA